jgi:hypothetical protein
MELEALLLGLEGLGTVESEGRREGEQDIRLKKPPSSICHEELEHAFHSRSTNGNHQRARMLA